MQDAVPVCLACCSAPAAFKFVDEDKEARSRHRPPQHPIDDDLCRAGSDPHVVGVVSEQEEEYQSPLSTEDNNIFGSGSGFANKLIAQGKSNWQWA